MSVPLQQGVSVAEKATAPAGNVVIDVVKQEALTQVVSQVMDRVKEGVIDDNIKSGTAAACATTAGAPVVPAAGGATRTNVNAMKNCAMRAPNCFAAC